MQRKRVPAVIPETREDQNLKKQGHLATESFAVGKAAMGPREATPDVELVDTVTVAVLAAAQALANMNGDNEREGVRSAYQCGSAPGRRFDDELAELNLSMPDTSEIIIQKLLEHEVLRRRNLASNVGEIPDVIR